MLGLSKDSFTNENIDKGVDSLNSIILTAADKCFLKLTETVRNGKFG